MTVNVNTNQKSGNNGNFVNTKFEEDSTPKTEEKKVNSSKNASLAAPWVIYYKKVAELLYGDEEVEVSELDENNDKPEKSFTIATDNFAKLTALKKILKNDIKFGNITLHINFMDASDGTVTVEDWETAFKGNEYFEGISGSDPKHPAPEGFKYALFSRDIIDFYNDDLTDCYGYDHVLPANIAKEITNENSTIYPSTIMEEDD